MGKTQHHSHSQCSLCGFRRPGQSYVNFATKAVRFLQHSVAFAQQGSVEIEALPPGGVGGGVGGRAMTASRRHWCRGSSCVQSSPAQKFHPQKSADAFRLPRTKMSGLRIGPRQHGLGGPSLTLTLPPSPMWTLGAHAVGCAASVIRRLSWSWRSSTRCLNGIEGLRRLTPLGGARPYTGRGARFVKVSLWVGEAQGKHPKITLTQRF